MFKNHVDLSSMIAKDKNLKERKYFWRLFSAFPIRAAEREGQRGQLAPSPKSTRAPEFENKTENEQSTIKTGASVSY